ncbi:hypothetical protein [Amycolatopsis thermoflava]|uniref:hypothetical protein n=1 Tax=Amycolatopsis thermoflava TaxID=84480 RepID=UPI0036544682
MGTTQYVHKISQDELCALLEVDERGLQKLARRHGLPGWNETDEDGTWWSIPEIRSWIAETGYREPRDLALDWWVDGTEPARFLGAELVRRRAAEEPAAVLQRWRTASGDVVVAWGTGRRGIGRIDLAEWAPDADAWLVVDGAWGRSGPDLETWLPTRPDADSELVNWVDLARVLGRPAPYWPGRLRHPELILAWRPGDPLVRHVGVLPLDIQPLVRMALLYPPEHVTHRALIHTAQVIANRNAAHRCTDLNILARRLEDGLITERDIVLAADAVPGDDSLPWELDQSLARAGWREVLHRNDRLAEECVLTAIQWDGGKIFPWSYIVTIPRTETGAEFLARLEPVAERTAIYYALDHGHATTAAIDPITEMPVALPADDGGDVTALAPQRLPATTPLAELILDKDGARKMVWIRTEDGTLFPAPNDHYAGVSWGYNGSGPGTLAALVNVLLDDINAQAASITDDAPRGLVTLFRQDWAPGTILTREQLEKARSA